MPRIDEDDLDWVGVVSSNISEIAYSEAGSRLYIRFNSGHEGYHTGVDQETYENLRDAGSVGGFYAQAIKGQYPWHKLS